MAPQDVTSVYVDIVDAFGTDVGVVKMELGIVEWEFMQKSWRELHGDIPMQVPFLFPGSTNKALQWCLRVRDH